MLGNNLFAGFCTVFSGEIMCWLSGFGDAHNLPLIDQGGFAMSTGPYAQVVAKLPVVDIVIADRSMTRKSRNFVLLESRLI